MEVKTEMKQNDNGSYTVKTTKTITPADGFVPDRMTHRADMDVRTKLHKGYQRSTSYTTNDPRVTRPFMYGICAIFFLIGLGALLFREFFFGLFFITMAVAAFFQSKKDIDRIQRELDHKKNNIEQNNEENRNNDR